MQMSRTETTAITEAKMDNAKKLIMILESVPKEKRDLVAMLGVAYISGIEASEGLLEVKEK